MEWRGEWRKGCLGRRRGSSRRLGGKVWWIGWMLCGMVSRLGR